MAAGMALAPPGDAAVVGPGAAPEPTVEFVASAGAATASPGTRVVHRVTVTNRGGGVLAGVTFSVGLGGVLDDAAFRTARATAGTVLFIDPVLYWTGDLAAGATAAVTYVVDVSYPDRGDHRLTATVVSGTSGSNCPAAARATTRHGSAPSRDARCSTSVPIREAELDVRAERADLAPGETVRFRFTMRNLGQTALRDVNFVSFADAVSVTFGRPSATSGEVTVPPWSTSDFQWHGDLPIGASVTVAMAATVAVPFPHVTDHPVLGVYARSPDSSDCAPSPGFPRSSGRETTRQELAGARCHVVLPILTSRIAASVSTGTVRPGEVQRYTVRVTNTSRVPRADLSLSDDLRAVLDDATYGNDAKATSGVVGLLGSTLSWSGVLGSGQAAVVAFSVRTRTASAGDGSLDTRITSSARGSNCPVPKLNTPPPDAVCSTHARVVRPGVRPGVRIDVRPGVRPGVRIDAV